MPKSVVYIHNKIGFASSALTKIKRLRSFSDQRMASRPCPDRRRSQRRRTLSYTQQSRPERTPFTFIEELGLADFRSLTHVVLSVSTADDEVVATHGEKRFLIGSLSPSLGSDLTCSASSALLGNPTEIWLDKADCACDILLRRFNRLLVQHDIGSRSCRS